MAQRLTDMSEFTTEAALIESHVAIACASLVAARKITPDATTARHLDAMIDALDRLLAELDLQAAGTERVAASHPTGIVAFHA